MTNDDSRAGVAPPQSPNTTHLGADDDDGKLLYLLGLPGGLRILGSVMQAMGHRLAVVPHVAGGMNGIRFNEDGSMTGAACWRADGTAIGIGGGLARLNTRFWPEAPRV